MIRLCFLMVFVRSLPTALFRSSPLAVAASSSVATASSESAIAAFSTMFGQAMFCPDDDGAELELVAGEGERAGAVAVAGVARQLRQHADADVEHAALLGRLAPPPFSICSKMSVSMSPRKTDRIAGGASLAPSR